MKIPFLNNESKPEPKSKKFVGMSSRATPIDKIVSDIKPVAKPIHIRTSLFKPLQPYLAIIADDIKGLVKRDEKSMQMKKEYAEFMENYFGDDK